ncbi:hypothetical protein [Dyella sp. Tek66A03]|uniref:hypothetical protein n=1 Tax=Dyella sp. Tek66A03 TaxID=3458298 RepID=UPI00403E494F
MSYVSRMCARLLAPSVLPLLAALLAATIAQTLSDLPAQLGGAPAWPRVPGTLVAIGVGASALYYLIQMVRLLRWRQGRTDSCYVCTCLLGRERQGRWGEYRRCLGCGKNHST